MKAHRKYAAHIITLPDGITLHNAIVVIEDGMVIDRYTFSEEQAHTLWLGGTIVVRKSEGGVLRAYKDGYMLP
ncbi:hypothetical protein [Hoylesella saccharolytica]|uniref:hypothetical protein n=1 Tax=Hoylesella saccharolytica TaxID=633701 RepID=UPI00046F3C42|nr:hypothetical protein [Hoylesella saccharolytica]